VGLTNLERRRIDSLQKQWKDVERRLGRNAFNELRNLTLIPHELHAAKFAQGIAYETFKTSHKELRKTIEPILGHIARDVARTYSLIQQLDLGDFRQSLSALNSLRTSPSFVDAIKATSQALVAALNNRSRSLATVPRVDFSQLAGLKESVAFASLASLDFPKFSSDLADIQDLRSSFSGQVATAIQDILEAQESTDEKVDRLHRLVETKVESLRKGAISREGLLTLVLTIFSLIYNHCNYKLAEKQAASSDKSSAAQLQESKEANRILEQILSQIERLNPGNDSNTYYIVERGVSLRIRPQSKAGVVGVLSRGTKVRLIERKHEWIYVEYFDYLEGVPKTGWALKKYLQRLD
jgi:hypothetical protein